MVLNINFDNERVSYLLYCTLANSRQTIDNVIGARYHGLATSVSLYMWTPKPALRSRGTIWGLRTNYPDVSTVRYSDNVPDKVSMSCQIAQKATESICFCKTNEAAPTGIEPTAW